MRRQKPEAAFQAQVIALARLRGWRCAHFRGVRVQRGDGSCFWQTPVQGDGAGFPDLILARHRPGVEARLLAIELKVPPNTTTPEQRAWLELFLVAGVTSCVWTPEDWPEIERMLE